MGAGANVPAVSQSSAVQFAASATKWFRVTSLILVNFKVARLVFAVIVEICPPNEYFLICFIFANGFR